MKMEQIVFRNVGIQQSDAGEIPKRRHTRFKTWPKFEIKNTSPLWGGYCKAYTSLRETSHQEHTSHPAYEDGTDSVSKRRHTTIRRRGNTQKKTYNNEMLSKSTKHLLK